MALQNKSLKPRRNGIQDILAFDIDPDMTRCVRLKRNAENLAVLAVALMPPIDFSGNKITEIDGIAAFDLPKNLSAKGVVMTIPGTDAVVKLLNLPGTVGADALEKVKEHLGVDDDGYRIAYKEIRKESARETRLLAVAVPEILVRAACRLFPSGNPVPVSVEVSGLAALTAFEEGPLAAHPADAVGVIEVGPRSSFVAFFNKLELVLVRKFDFGLWHLFDRIQQDLGLDRATVMGLLTDNAFDVSQAVKEVSEPFIKQMIISRHFVERREDCRIIRMYVPGGPTIPADWIKEVKFAMGFDVDFWDPFATPRLKLPADGIGDQTAPYRSRFAAALGAGLGVLQKI